MTLALAVLLLVTPPQVSQDSTEALREHVQELEARIATLEERQDIRRGYYMDSLWAERTAYAAFLTLVGGLFVLINFVVVRWRIRQLEDETETEIEEARDDVKEEMTEYVDSESENLEEDIDQLRGFAAENVGELRYENELLRKDSSAEISRIYESIYDLREYDYLKNLKPIEERTRRLFLSKKSEYDFNEKMESGNNIFIASLEPDLSLSGEISKISDLVDKIGDETEVNIKTKSRIERNFDRIVDLSEDDSTKDRIQKLNKAFDEAA